ncbi:recombinase family protein [Paenibacillus alginolyticus]
MPQPTGKLMFTIVGAIAEFEKDLINERTAEGCQHYLSTFGSALTH